VKAEVERGIKAIKRIEEMKLNLVLFIVSHD